MRSEKWEIRAVPVLDGESALRASIAIAKVAPGLAAEAFCILHFSFLILH